MSRIKPFPPQQRGAALLMMMLAVIIAMSTVMLSKLNRNDLRTRQLTQTQATLAEARAALLDFAMLNPDTNPLQPHSLPCPDIDDTGGFAEGEAHSSSCGAQGVSVTGRLPWRTLGIPALKDAASACLWYVVSGSYKQAGSDTQTMINSDSNGQLQLLDIETGTIREGQDPEDRPIAMIFAAMQPLAGQTRPGYVAGQNCSAGADAASYLDTDSVSGVANSTLLSSADVVDLLAVASGWSEEHNDRVVTISRADLERAVRGRADFLGTMRGLGLVLAECLADYAGSNPGGINDKRLPWPAPVELPDYRADSAYDDINNGFISGRLPDGADDSNAVTGNTITRVISNCNSASVTNWSAQQHARWQHWKDHFFYAVAESHGPLATVPSACSSCLTVNGGGQYAAVVMFSGSRLGNLGQIRNAPPIDPDTKRTVSNYLEDQNAANVPGAAAALNFVSGAASGGFNDLLFCIDPQLVVTEC